MGHREKDIKAVAALGERLRKFSRVMADSGSQSALWPDLQLAMEAASTQNPWFTLDDQNFALAHWGNLLEEKALQSWLANYPIPGSKAQTIGLVLAGNVPLVGFHDLLCVLLSGHRALAKCSSNDTILLPFLARELQRLHPDWQDRIEFTDRQLTGFNAVIATGSNNTSRYFEYYFGRGPHIIRKNRNSIAVLSGEETAADLDGLADDVFRFFGMGCRSVSKLYVPAGYNFDPLFTAFYRYRELTDHQKYANNYDYNKAVFLMSGAPMLDNGFLLLKEDAGLGSPIGTLFYESYKDSDHLASTLAQLSESLQCVVGVPELGGMTPFGQSQHPALDAYADGVDTLEFLCGLTGN